MEGIEKSVFKFDSKVRAKMLEKTSGHTFYSETSR